LKIGLFDIEANGLLDTVTKVHCCVIKEYKGEVRKFWPWEGGDFIKQMLDYLSSFDVLIAHNGIGYDFPVLKKLYGWEYKGKKVDTVIMSRLLNPKRLVPFNCPNKKAGPHSLESWGYRVGRGKPEHEDWERFSEEMLHRCTEDVEITELVYDALIEESKVGKWRNAFLLSFELFERLQQQEEYGWLVDKDHMHKCVRQLTKWIERIDRVITPHLPQIIEIEETKEKGEYKYIKKPFLKSGEYSQSVHDWCARSDIDVGAKPVAGCFSRISFRVTDLDSGAETKDFLLSMGWEPLEWNTNDDGERTSPKLSKDDPFEGIESKIGKLVAKRVQCRQRRGIIEGLLGLVREDGRIASVVNTLAVTGRATHRNIVNIPKASSFFGKQMRQIFTSKPGYVLVGTDSAGNQLRQLAARMNNEKYIYAMVSGNKEDGTDPHTLTKVAGDLESRDIAKNVMYCLLFGGGDVKLAKTAKKPAGTGADLRAKLYKGLDGLGELMERLTKEWKDTARQRYNQQFRRMEYFDGTITGLDGRPIKVPSEHQLLVYLLQSDEAIHMARAYVILCAELEKKYVWGKDYGVICWYHDEYTIECKQEIADDVKRISEDAIRQAGEYYKITCPHAGEGAIGRNWYDIH
jgi:DNA polymerase I-like protein with 3'-5' exonuclease and polymerase domains